MDSQPLTHALYAEALLSGADAVPAAPVLLVARDRAVVDVIRRAAGGAASLAAIDGVPTSDVWAGARIVLVHDAVASEQQAQSALAALPRRDGVIVIAGPGPDSVDDTEVWRAAARLGAERVVVLPDALPWLTSALADHAAAVAVARPGGLAAHVVGVVGGCGGAGSSMLAGALASRAARRGVETTLVDLDPAGPGVDLLLGLEGVDGLRWDGLAHVRGRTDGGSVRRLLPGAGRLAVLARGVGPGPDAPAVQAVVSGLADVRGLVVLDLPRTAALSGTPVSPRASGSTPAPGVLPAAGEAGAGGSAGSSTGRSDPPVTGCPARTALSLCDEVLLVCPDDPMAVAAAARLLPGLAGLPTSLVVRTSGRSERPGGGSDWVRDLLGVPIAGVLGADPAARSAAARGEGLAGGRGPLARCADALVARLSLDGAAGAA